MCSYTACYLGNSSPISRRRDLTQDEEREAQPSLSGTARVMLRVHERRIEELQQPPEILKGILASVHGVANQIHNVVQPL